MDDLNQLLENYHNDGYYWNGTAFVPFWDDELRIWLRTYDPEPTPRQVWIVREILAFPHDLRKPFEEAIVKYYQAHVYGAIDFGTVDGQDLAEIYAPKLDHPSDIWDLLSEDEIWISDYTRKESSVEFKLTFACTWDEEHGLGVKSQDWQIVSFGSAVS